jgi:hypothetical protein
VQVLDFARKKEEVEQVCRAVERSECNKVAKVWWRSGHWLPGWCGGGLECGCSVVCEGAGEEEKRKRTGDDGRCVIDGLLS